MVEYIERNYPGIALTIVEICGVPIEKPDKKISEKLHRTNLDAGLQT
jgi:hypothetical protein